MLSACVFFFLALLITYLVFRSKRPKEESPVQRKQTGTDYSNSPFEIQIDPDLVEFPYADKKVLIHSIKLILLAYLENFQFFLKNITHLDPSLNATLLVYPNWSEYKSSPEAENVDIKYGLVRLIEHHPKTFDHHFEFAVTDIALQCFVTIQMPSGTIHRVLYTIAKVYGAVSIDLNLRKPFAASINWSHLSYKSIEKSTLTTEIISKLDDILTLENWKEEMIKHIPNSSAEFILDQSYRITGTNISQDHELSSNYKAQGSPLNTMSQSDYPKKLLLVYVDYIILSNVPFDFKNPSDLAVHVEIISNGVTKISRSIPLSKVILNKVSLKETFVFPKRPIQNIKINFLIGNSVAATLNKQYNKKKMNKTYVLTTQMVSSNDFMDSKFKSSIEITNANITVTLLQNLNSQNGSRENIAQSLVNKKIRVKSSKNASKNLKSSNENIPGELVKLSGDTFSTAESNKDSDDVSNSIKQMSGQEIYPSQVILSEKNNDGKPQNSQLNDEEKVSLVSITGQVNNYVFEPSKSYEDIPKKKKTGLKKLFSKFKSTKNTKSLAKLNDADDNQSRDSSKSFQSKDSKQPSQIFDQSEIIEESEQKNIINEAILDKDDEKILDADQQVDKIDENESRSIDLKNIEVDKMKPEKKRMSSLKKIFTQKSKSSKVDKFDESGDSLSIKGSQNVGSQGSKPDDLSIQSTDSKKKRKTLSKLFGSSKKNVTIPDDAKSAVFDKNLPNDSISKEGEILQPAKTDNPKNKSYLDLNDAVKPEKKNKSSLKKLFGKKTKKESANENKNVNEETFNDSKSSLNSEKNSEGNNSLMDQSFADVNLNPDKDGEKIKRKSRMLSFKKKK